MAFSDDAIGFFLQLDDQLSPALATAEGNYHRFVRSLDKYNRQAFRSANQGMEALGEVVDSFTALPRQAEAAYSDALRRMAAKSKPLTQRVDLVFTVKAQKELGRAIGEALSKVLGKAKLRLTADIPQVRSKLFDTRVALRTAYRDQIQPPDMAGMFQSLPHFQEGGIVGGRGDIDKVLALLTPGEMVLPKKVAESLREMAELQKGQRLAQGLTDAVVDIENLAKGLERVQDLTETGLDPSAVQVYAAGVAALNKRYQDLLAVVGGISDKKLPKFIGVLKDAKAQVDKFAKSLDKAEDQGKETEKGLGRIGRAVKFLATRAGIQDVQDGLRKLQSGVTTTFQTLETGEQIGTFIQNFERVNSRLQLSREGLGGLRRDFIKTFGKLAPANLDLNLASDALADLAEVTGEAGAETQALAITMAKVRQVTKASEGAVVGLADSLRRIGGLDPDAIAVVFEQGRRAAQGTRTTAEQLFEQTAGFAEQGGARFQELTKQQRVNFLSNLQGMSAALSQAVGPDTAKEIADVTAAAFAGVPEAVGRFAVITGKDITTFRTELTKAGGDLTSVAQGIQQQFSQAPPEAFASFASLTDLSASNLKKLASEMPVVVTRMQQTQGQTLTAAQAHAGLNVALEGSVNKFKALQIEVNNWLVQQEKWGVGAAEVINVMAEMPASIVLVGLELTRTLIPALSKSLYWIGLKILALGKWAFASKAAAAATVATEAATTSAAGGMGKAVGGIGATISSFLTTMATGVATVLTALGRGIGGFLTGIGTGLATFLTSLAAGLTALTPAIPVILVLSVAILAMGAALKLAEKPLVALFGFLETVVGAVAATLGKALDSIVTLMLSFKDMHPARLAALAASLILLGPAFISLGVGILALSGSLGLSTVGFAAFQGVMALLGGSLAGGASSISALVEGLARAFAVEPAMLAQALATVQATTDFLVEFAKVAGVLAALAVGATIGSAVERIFEWFGADSPLTHLQAQAENISEVMRGFVGTFTVLGGVLAGKEAGVVQALTMTGNVISSVGMLATRLTALGRTVGGMDAESILQTGRVAQAVVRSAGAIRQTLGEALSATLGAEVPALSLQAKVVPPITRTMIQQAILVKLAPNTTDAPVLAELEQTNSLLAELLVAVREGATAVPTRPRAAPARAPRVGGVTRDVAEGR